MCYRSYKNLHLAKAVPISFCSHTSNVIQYLQKMSSELKFFVNGKLQLIKGPIDPDMKLSHYLRKDLRLTGTKVGCNEGGCGSCTVTLSRYKDGKMAHLAISACLTRVASLHGTEITTTEGLGGSEMGEKLHPVQERLWKAHGAQCGFCSPGMVMSMSSVLRDKGGIVDIEDVQGCLQGNLCRCTGYRPIVEGFATFCKDSQDKSHKDMENVQGYDEVLKIDRGDLAPYAPHCDDPKTPDEIEKMALDDDIVELSCLEGRSWFYPKSLSQLRKLLQDRPNGNFAIYGGGTMFPKDKLEMPIIQLTYVKELHKLSFHDQQIQIGSALTLDEVKKVFQSLLASNEDDILKTVGESGRSLIEAILKALETLGSPQVRNVGTLGGHIIWGGSCALSDLAPILIASGTVLQWQQPNGTITETPLSNDIELKSLSKNGVLCRITIPVPPRNSTTAFYRSAKRKEFSFPVANAGIQAQIVDGVVEDIRISFGGSEPDYGNKNGHTPRLEKNLIRSLKGKQIGDLTPEYIKEAIKSSNIQGYDQASGAWREYREQQYASFLHKFFSGEDVTCKIKQSEKTSLLTYQKVDENQAREDTVTRPVPNLWAAEMASGSAVYIDDMPALSGELQLVLVQSTKAHAKLLRMDFSKALQVKGVVGVVSAGDLSPDKNKWGTVVPDDVVFCEKEVLHFGQILAAIACETIEAGKEACRLVGIEYEDLPAIITIPDAKDSDSKLGDKIKLERNQDSDVSAKGQARTIKGTVHLGGQEQFYMETNGSLVVPVGEKDECVVYTSTQEPAMVQRQVAGMLGVPQHKVVVKTKRVGGGFGGKQKALHTLVAAVAARKFKRPCRIILSRKEDVALMGHRHEALANYEVEYDDYDGKLLKAKLRMFANGGYSNDLSMPWIIILVLRVDGGYTLRNVDIEGTACKTHTTSNTAMRGFGGPEGGMIIDTILSHVAHELGVDPTKVREVNLTEEGDLPHYGEARFEGVTLGKCWEECKSRSQYDLRKKSADEHNLASKYIKRGVALVPMKFPITMGYKPLMQGTALLRVYLDGTVLLSHGGAEMGQGLHTKMIQVAGRGLGIPVEKIHIAETSTDAVPNATPTGGSVGADLNGAAVMDACRQLKSQLKPYLSRGKTWEEAVQAAYDDHVSLCVVGYNPITKVDFDFDKLGKGKITDYYVYGAGMVEVEVDCRDGDVTVLSADLVVDVGRSLNPAVDLGQIEGSFMQALGYVTTEQLLTDAKTGALITCVIRATKPLVELVLYILYCIYRYIF